MALSKEDASDKEVCTILTPLKYLSHFHHQFIKMLWMDKLPSTRYVSHPQKRQGTQIPEDFPQN